VDRSSTARRTAKNRISFQTINPRRRAYVAAIKTTRIVAAFNQARDEEYSEFLEKGDDLLRELEKESGRGKFTFAELEENEDEFHKLTNWYQKITERDFHGASLRPSADEKLEQCRVQLEAFSAKVYRRNDEEPR
jgi:hypothetical protein